MKLSRESRVNKNRDEHVNSKYTSVPTSHGTKRMASDARMHKLERIINPLNKQNRHKEPQGYNDIFSPFDTWKCRICHGVA